MSNDELADAMRARGLSATGIKDFFDLAEAFLGSASIQQMLTRLERETLAVLAVVGSLTGADPHHGGATTAESDRHPTAADVAGRLLALGAPASAQGPVTAESVAARAAEAARLLLLQERDGRLIVYDDVRTQLASWPSLGLPGFDELVATPPPASLGSVPDIDRRFVDRLAADHAFAATTAMTELLTELEREPARELSRGGIALPDSKRLAGVMSTDLDAVAVYLDIAERAGLIAKEHNSWLVTEAAGSWLRQASGARWVLLARAWLDRLPGDIRHLLSERTHSLWGAGLRGYIDWLYPAGGDWMDERVRANTQHAELLGITATNAPSGPGSLLVAGDMAAAEAAMTALLPTEVEQVYLQHDLSVVSPGPLTPHIDARLRTLADVENRSLASSYRISASSLNRAMAAGETAQSLLAFLDGVSLTGIPQPLDYLIAETAERYGLVRVGAEPNGPREAKSYLRSDDGDLLAAIAVDQNLLHLGLVRVSSGRILTRCELDTVFWALSEARYPVAAEDADGGIVSLGRRHSTRGVPAPAADPIDTLLERLRLGGEPGDDENDQAWLVRQIEVAIRARAVLTVTITMPNGSSVDYQLEPTSLAGGRLRARDRKSAIERTLPLSSIATIGPAL
jgi:hypothetical protein